MSKGRLRRVEFFALEIPLREPFQIALQTASVANNVFVRVTTDEGIEGWGEASPLHAVTGETVETCLAAGRFLAQELIDKDVRETRQRQHEMAAVLPHNTAVRSAIDIALYDASARGAGMPLYRFLGGSQRELVTDITLGIGSTDATLANARRAAEMGFGNIKVKLGLDIDRDLAVLRGLRQELGKSVRLRLDANQAWGRHEAVENLQRMSDYEIQFCEQPVRMHDVDGLSFVSDRSPIPIMADEAAFGPAEVLRVANETRVPLLNLKVAKTGGLGPLLQADVIAATAGLHSMLGCMMESRLGLTASAHAALVCESVRYLDLDTFFELAEDPVVGGVRYEGEKMILPEAPGLGATLDPEVLAGSRVHLVE